MDLRQLRYFVAVARERNFTRAAEILHIAQPPLSRQIQLLEESLGVELIMRSTRPIRLTDAGKRLYEEALQVLNRVEQMERAARQNGANERRIVSIAFVASTLYGGLPTIMRRLRQLRPELEIRLVEMIAAQQIEALKSGRIDIGFGRVRTEDANVERLVLREERLVVAIPMDDPLAQHNGPVSIDVIAGQKLLVYPSEPRPSFADQVLSLLEDHSVTAESVYEVRELQIGLGLVVAGMGLCIIPASARTMRRDLHYRLIAEENATSPIIMSYRRNDDSDLIDLVKNLVSELHAENPDWMNIDDLSPDSAPQNSDS